MLSLKAQRYVALSRFISSVGLLIGSAEALSRRDLYRRGNILGGQADVLHPNVAKRLPSLIRVINSGSLPIVQNIAVLAVSVLTIVKPNSRGIRSNGAHLIAVSYFIDRHRNQHGRDGADAMQEVLAIFTSAVSVLPADIADDTLLQAINAEAAVAYFASGLVKLVSPEWRSGRAIDGVMATSNYGNNTIATALERHPNFAKIACWSTILAETAFPAIYLLPTRFVSPTLAVVLFFHITVGYAMGLPRFIWAFGATHPAILYVCKKSEKKSAA